MTRKFFAALLLVVLASGTSISAEKALKVTQPAYRSMSFYVYKPVNVPRDFYVTFDGYLVYKDTKGVWCYGSADTSGITKTGYVVGSVLPYVVKLRPYDVKISSVAPILHSNRVIDPPAAPNIRPESKADRIVYMPPEMYSKVYSSRPVSPNASDWNHFASENSSRLERRMPRSYIRLERPEMAANFLKVQKLNSKTNFETRDL